MAMGRPKAELVLSVGQREGLIKTGDLAPRLMAPRDILFLVCQWGAGKIDAAETAAAFFRYTAGMPKTGWRRPKYLSTGPEFTVGRSLWINVFQALEDSDGATLADAAQKLSALKAGGK